MGQSSWSDTFYSTRQATLRSTGKSHFAYDADIKTGKTVAKIHDDLNPHGVKNRESRDSDAHPNSKAIAVLFDITASMGTIPEVLQSKLGGLMKLLLQKSYVDDPQILFGAIGDASPRCNNAPLQVAQFESGIEMDDHLGKIWIEGGGGGQMRESYELAMYFMSRHTSIDCFEKRREKGYLFLTGDEMPYDIVNRDQVKRIIGDDVEEDISTKDIIDELSTKYDVFFIYINSRSYAGSKNQILKHWENLLPERVIDLENPEEVCEVIASTIAMCEGVADVDTAINNLKDVGLSGSDSVKNALVAVGAGVGAGKNNVVAVDGDLEEGEDNLESI